LQAAVRSGSYLFFKPDYEAAPVHIASGSAALAYSLYAGRRYGYEANFDGTFQPSNISYVVLGTTMMFVGWLGELPRLSQEAADSR
jgi:Amt family ammonium transporter